MFFQKKDFFPDFDPEQDLPEKTGPARFWELIKDELATVLVLNLLFVVTCVPIVTIPPVLLVPFALCTTVLIVTMLASTYLYGLLCDGRTLRDAVRPALLLGVAKPLRAVLAALCWYGVLLLAVLFFPLSGAYLFLLGFSLPCLLGHFYLRTVLKQYCGDQR